MLDGRRLKERNSRFVSLILWGSLLLNAILLMSWLFRKPNNDISCPYIFHGSDGLVPDALTGCWCGKDDYCLCTPSLAIDTLILGPDDSILLVEREDTGKHALPGGFVNWGERVEDAVIREVHEETNLVVEMDNLSLFGVYSNPRRDYRRHTASVVYVIRVDAGTLRHAKSGDDAKAVVKHSLAEAVSLSDLAFDHQDIIRDFLQPQR